MTAYGFHPAIADACGHGLAAIAEFGQTENLTGAFVGEGAERIHYFGSPKGTRIFAYSRVRPGSEANVLLGDIRVYAEDGTRLSDLEGGRMRYLEVSDEKSEAVPDDWFYRVAWEEQPFASVSNESLARHWVILADRGGVGEALAKRLQVSECSHSLVEGLSTLESALSAAGTGAIGVVDLRCLDTSGCLAAEEACLAVVRLVRQLVGRADGSDVRLWAVTRGQSTGREAVPVSPGHAPLWGLGRTIAIEQPDLWGGMVNLEPGAGPAEDSALLGQFLISTHSENQVAFRNGRLLAPRLERYPPPAVRTLTLRGDAAYLITGGFGGLGLEVARWMVGLGARRLILMGRTELPPRSEWSRLTPGFSV